MKKVVVFDVMGVIFTVGDDTSELLIPYIQSIKGTQACIIKNAYIDASLGRISAEEFWIRAGFEKGEIEQHQSYYLNNSFTLDKGFIPCAERLKKHYRLALLSNDLAEWGAYLRKKFSFEHLIDNAFISSDMGLRKPDPEIYRKALAELNVKPGECVFIDDFPDRADAASELGITSILFNRESHTYNGLQIRSFDELARLLI